MTSKDGRAAISDTAFACASGHCRLRLFATAHLMFRKRRGYPAANPLRALPTSEQALRSLLPLESASHRRHSSTQGEQVAVQAEAADLALHDVREHLSLIHI